MRSPRRSQASSLGSFDLVSDDEEFRPWAGLLLEHMWILGRSDLVIRHLCGSTARSRAGLMVYYDTTRFALALCLIGNERALPWRFIGCERPWARISFWMLWRNATGGVREWTCIPLFWISITHVDTVESLGCSLVNCRTPWTLLAESYRPFLLTKKGNLLGNLCTAVLSKSNISNKSSHNWTTLVLLVSQW